MTIVEKAQLLDAMSESQAATRAVWEQADPEFRVHGDTGWLVRDILAHIAVWDLESAKSLRAYRAGGEYALPVQDEDDFNNQSILEWRDLSDEAVLDQYGRARQEFKDAVQDIPPEKYPGDLLYPWGDERGTVAQLVDYMIEHEAEHRQEILKAFKAS
jgi:hypothetical protein